LIQNKAESNKYLQLIFNIQNNSFKVYKKAITGLIFLEAKKLAFEARAKFYADPEFNKIPVSELISKEYAAGRRQMIDLNRSARRYDAGNPALKHGDTIYLTVADKQGNMISLIQSNYRRKDGMAAGY